jgi:hypothetical protein
MPLVILHEEGRACPTLICDACGQKIETARAGSYQWDFLDGGPVFFVHKACHQRLEARHERHMGWCELEALLVYLRNSLGVDMKQAEKTAAFLSRTG